MSLCANALKWRYHSCVLALPITFIVWPRRAPSSGALRRSLPDLDCGGLTGESLPFLLPQLFLAAVFVFFVNFGIRLRTAWRSMAQISWLRTLGPLLSVATA